jgi:outer membrane immunogenic protein
MKKYLAAAVALTALSSAASAADLASRRVAVPAAIVAPAFSWTGFYVGLNAGYGLANTNVRALTDGVMSGNAGGFIGGAQIGYNYQINNVVLGAEGDFGYFGARRSFTDVDAVAGVTTTASWKTSWDASIRARLGVAVDRTLFYVTGGIAFADFGLKASVTDGGVTQSLSGSQTRVGWTLGAGVEYAVTQNLTVRGEYLYANYGSKNLGLSGTGGFERTPGLRLETHKFRVGVNYLFSTGPSPIVARY